MLNAQPVYHTQKPIILGVDDRLESPDTLTLRYEEAARAASGGGPRGDSPPTVLDMATYTKAQLPSMHGKYLIRGMVFGRSRLSR